MRSILVFLVLSVVAWEFLAAVALVRCEVRSSDYLATDGICRVELICEDGASRSGFVHEERYDCPPQVWCSPLWEGPCNANIFDVYRWSSLVVLLGAVLWGPAGLLNPRERLPPF